MRTPQRPNMDEAGSKVFEFFRFNLGSSLALVSASTRCYTSL